MNCLYHLFVLVASLQMGRQIDLWPYDKLFKQADTVVVAKAIQTIDAGDRIKDKVPREYLKAVLTTFEVTHVIKGKSKEKLVLCHFLYDERKKDLEIQNGPMLVDFHNKTLVIRYPGVAVSLSPPDYMLFLRGRPDGRYECVSGQFDPALSVKQIINPLDPPRVPAGGTANDNNRQAETYTHLYKYVKVHDREHTLKAILGEPREMMKSNRPPSSTFAADSLATFGPESISAVPALKQIQRNPPNDTGAKAIERDRTFTWFGTLGYPDVKDSAFVRVTTANPVLLALVNFTCSGFF
jgi:hypothetical protein